MVSFWTFSLPQLLLHLFYWFSASWSIEEFSSHACTSCCRQQYYNDDRRHFILKNSLEGFVHFIILSWSWLLAVIYLRVNISFSYSFYLRLLTRSETALRADFRWSLWGHFCLVDVGTYLLCEWCGYKCTFLAASIIVAYKKKIVDKRKLIMLLIIIQKAIISVDGLSIYILLWRPRLAL
jgi:hypothetical protein